jgi:hypothetical protein
MASVVLGSCLVDCLRFEPRDNGIGRPRLRSPSGGIEVWLGCNAVPGQIHYRIPGDHERVGSLAKRPAAERRQNANPAGVSSMRDRDDCFNSRIVTVVSRERYQVYPATRAPAPATESASKG